ncbi:MAG: hypothetical protein A4E52_00254 [Pelotomaculum sp. PtaB.Bin013]|uniref:DUF456 domain-containing protein n=1 Tax=Pelotomaculum isophthalicicum JI TaxID=947010 RepID=A0A9X4H729_9FIRM|nr:DUF456 domain-containing protein [Pelotomaculum isophthalicicum]MDF9407339.1 DUF456 domain-containing protein [Pelotomaculum isophthalicicum JI]OPX91927.1 MAG: hypothetical protein A4E52_00254 [Pelotomaculum sp. PtaB.Bin013]
MSLVGIVIAVVFFTAGIIGTIMPVLPGAPLIWLGMLIYGIFVKFNNMSWLFFAGQGLVVALVFLIDYLAGVWGVKRYGGSKAAVWGSVIGGILGILLLGPFGLIFGPFIGAVAGELYRKSDLNKAFQVGIGTLIGFLGGTILKLAVEVLMIIWFFTVIY